MIGHAGVEYRCRTGARDKPLILSEPHREGWMNGWTCRGL